MTVIASFQIESQIFLISDILISLQVPPTQVTVGRLPKPIQRFNVSMPADSKYTICNVLKKTVWITDKFVLSYAGPVESARYVIWHLRKWALIETPTGAQFEKELDLLSERGRLNGVSLLVCIVEGARTYVGGFNFYYFRNRKFSYLRAAGSGAKDLLDLFAAYRGKQTNRALSAFEEGLSLALALSSTLKATELITLEPLQRAYGGIYEITYWNGQGFEHIDEILHVHWAMHYEIGRGLGFDLPGRIQKIEYHNGCLYLRDIDLNSKEDERDFVYIVTEPATENTKRPDTIKPDLSYKWLVSHFYFVLPDGKVKYRNRVTYIQSGQFPLQITEQQDAIEFQLRPDYFESLKEEVAELEADWNPGPARDNFDEGSI